MDKNLAVSSERWLVDELVRRVLGWQATPDRFIKSGRKWLPKWRFCPVSRLADAFYLLDHSGASYRIEKSVDGKFTVEVRMAGRVGKCCGEQSARSVTFATAEALGIDIRESR